MSKSTVLQFAAELKLPVYALVEQLAKAGVEVTNSTDALSDSDKGKLLDYLRQQQGSTTTTKIILTRKKSTEVTATNPHGRQRIVQVQVRKQLKVPRIAVTRGNTELTTEQLEFLNRIGVPMSRVFNSEGMGQVECGRAMKALGKWIAFGVSPCGAKGHTLRTRKWHCIQCHPENLSYLRRHDEDGQVYVAYSFSKKLTKVGTAKDSADRIRNLNSYRYGGASDWRRCFAIHCNGAGKVESLAQQTLTSYSASGTYFKDGATISCQELFDCDVAVAVDAVNKAVVAAKCETTIVQRYEVSTPHFSYTKAAGTSSAPEQAPEILQQINEKIAVDCHTSQPLRIPEDRQLSNLSPERVAKLRGFFQKASDEQHARSNNPKKSFSQMVAEAQANMATTTVETKKSDVEPCCTKQPSIPLQHDDERTDREILLETNRLAHRIILKNARSIDEIEATWKIVNESIDALDLPPRVHQSLVLNNVVTVRQLLEYSADQLLQLEDMGRLGRNTITEVLSEHGLRLREKRTQPNQNLAIPEQKPQPVTAPVHQESQAIMSENLDAPLMATGYKVGDLVKHPTQSAWGVGEIISLQDNNLVEIEFDAIGKKTLSLNHVQLLKIGRREHKDNRPEDQTTPIQDFPKVLCANCGQPTQFGEKTAQRRAELGWCDSCYKHSQRTFQDKATGEKRYFDEFRTIDGIKSRFSPK